MSDSYFSEIISIQPGNKLYANWMKYTLSITKEDARKIVDGGLTYQARAIRSMIREITANQKVDEQLSKKLDLFVSLCEASAARIRE